MTFSVYTKIASITVTGSATSAIEFTSIPATYTDLVIKFSTRLSVADIDNVITLNTSVTKSAGKRVYGNGTNQASDTAVGGGLSNSSGYTASTFASTEYYFPNYTGTTNKTVSIDAVNENNSTQSYQVISAQSFTLGSAITSIKLTPNSGNYDVNSTAVLYGILKA